MTRRFALMLLASAGLAQAYCVIASAPGFAPHAGLVVPPNGAAQKLVLTPLSAAALPVPTNGAAQSLTAAP